jgi:replication factor C subunit 3/5
MCKVLASVSKKEQLNLPSHVATLLARLSSGNLRRALLSLEALHVRDPTFKSISPTHSLLVSANAVEKKDELDAVPRPDWETYLASVSHAIMSSQTPEKLLAVRAMLYELLVHCIPAPMILTVRASLLYICFLSGGD